MFKIKTVYCDFDGTITKQDAVNTFYERYASEEWKKSEDLWISGKITSRENSIRQVSLIKNISEQELNNYINSITVDEFFVEFAEFLKQQGIRLVILSDGFDLFIQKTLERLKIKDVDIYANHLIYDNGNFSVEFPYYNEQCDMGAGMCKCEKVKEKDFCFIGDGTSDLCIAKKAKVLFATKNLEEYCKKNSIEHYSYNSFYDVIQVFKNSVNENICSNI